MFVAVADLNANAVTDIAVANIHGNSVPVLLGTPQGGLQPASHHAVAADPQWLCQRTSTATPS